MSRGRASEKGHKGGARVFVFEVDLELPLNSKRDLKKFGNHCSRKWPRPLREWLSVKGPLPIPHKKISCKKLAGQERKES